MNNQYDTGCSSNAADERDADVKPQVDGSGCDNALELNPSFQQHAHHGNISTDR
jgi:hypothetical protein